MIMSGTGAAAEIEVFTLGRFEIFKQGRLLVCGPKAPRRQLQLLQAVVALGNGSVSVDRVGDALWPEAEGTAARAAVDITLLRLRALLGRRELITVQCGRVALNPKRCWVDTWAFEQTAERLRDALHASHDPPPDGLVEALVTIYRGDFLADQGAETWAVPLRARLRRTFRRLVTATGARWRSAGVAMDRIAELYERARDVVPEAEEVYRELMQCYWALGRRAEALHVYEECRRNLAELLGGDPSPETRAVYATLHAERRRD